MNRRKTTLIAVLVLLLAPATHLSAANFDIYGYVTNYLGMTFRGNDGDTNGTDVGYVLYLRLKGDWQPHERLTFHMETSYTGSLGNQNSWALMDYLGLLPFDPADFPTFDYAQSFEFDHIWGRWSTDAFDLSFGKIPIAWGTGYVFNPTARAANAGFLDYVREEPPGTFAVTAAATPFWWLTMEGYLAFQEKTHQGMVRMAEGSWSDLPFGLRLKFLAGPADLSAGILQEVADYDGSGNPEDGLYVTLDGIATLGPVGLYTECAFLLPVGDDGNGWKAWDALDGVLGLEWLLPGIPVTFRSEYYHQGAGVTDKGSYNITELFTGRQLLLAEDYLYSGLEWTFLDYGRLSAGGLVNLNDGSFMIAPQLAWDVLSDFTAELGAIFFVGEGDDEFGGLVVTPAGVVDLMDPNVYVRLKLSF